MLDRILDEIENGASLRKACKIAYTSAPCAAGKNSLKRCRRSRILAILPTFSERLPRHLLGRAPANGFE
jgi:hypothetical protein